MPSIRPSVVSVTPQDGATDVALNPTIYVVFNTDMAKDTINSTNIKLGDVPLNIEYYPLTRTAQIKTVDNLLPNTVYTLTIYGDDVYVGASVDGVTDILGTPMIGTFTASFTTGTTVLDEPPVSTLPSDIPVSAPVPFSIKSVWPSVDMSNISDGKIIITFSDTVDPTTVTADNIYLIRMSNI